jgi:hypothetical protein
MCGSPNEADAFLDDLEVWLSGDIRRSGDRTHSPRFDQST